MEIVFWLAATLFGINYALYPLGIILAAAMRSDSHDAIVVPDSYLPSISLIIAAYNEEKVIRAKILNSLEIDYPRDKLQIIVVTDGSDDATYEVAGSFADDGIVAMHRPERQGKSAAINRAASEATGEILLLSDANNDFNSEAARHLARHFYDRDVGGVSGAKHVYRDEYREATRGEGAYWKYEAAIKRAESRLGSVTSGDGEIFAVRRSCFRPIVQGMINDDAAITFDLVKSGSRVLYEEKAKSFEKASHDLVDDFNVKVRMAAGGFQTLVAERKFLVPPKTWFAFCFLMHKALRWFAPLFLGVILVTSILLISQPFFRLLLFAQLVFYGGSIIGWLNRKTHQLPGYLYMPMYFSVMNLALLVGLYRYIAGIQKVQWQKAAR